MAGTQEGPHYRDSPVSSSQKAHRLSEPGIASPRGSLLSTRGSRHAPGSRRTTVSAGLGPPSSPNAASGERSLAPTRSSSHLIGAYFAPCSLKTAWAATRCASSSSSTPRLWHVVFDQLKCTLCRRRHLAQHLEAPAASPVTRNNLCCGPIAPHAVAGCRAAQPAAVCVAGGRCA